jgi:hypothetical protein
MHLHKVQQCTRQRKWTFKDSKMLKGGSKGLCFIPKKKNNEPEDLSFQNYCQ